MPDPRPRSTAREGLTTEVRSAAALDPGIREDMYRLFARAYAATDRARFRADLATKRDVLLLRDGAGRLAGFTTLAVFDDEDRGRPIRVVFSGDTLVDPACWGSHALNFAWIRHMARIRDERPDTPLYWLLISKGYRTYRYLSTFALDYVPRRDGRDDPALSALRDRLAARLFESAFDPVRGIVAHDPPRDRLAPALTTLPSAGRAAQEARFFARANPGFTRGDELVCLCALDEDNMRPFARRLFARACG